MQTGQTVSPHPPCSPLLSVLALFFPFFPFIQTYQLRRRHRCRLHLASPSHRRYPVGATLTLQLPHQPWPLQLPPRHPLREPSTRWTRPHMRHRHTQATLPPSPSLCLVHLKKASDKSFPLFFPFVFNGAGHFPSTQARCTPRGTQAPTPPPLAHMQAAPSPSRSPQPPPPQCLYDRRHFPDPVAVQPASPDFATQTGGAKGALAPTISARPPFAHPPPLCRSFHSRGCPRCTLQFTRPPRPTPPHPPSSPACQGA